MQDPTDLQALLNRVLAEMTRREDALAVEEALLRASIREYGDLGSKAAGSPELPFVQQSQAEKREQIQQLEQELRTLNGEACRITALMPVTVQLLKPLRWRQGLA